MKRLRYLLSMPFSLLGLTFAIIGGLFCIAADRIAGSCHARNALAQVGHSFDE